MPVHFVDHDGNEGWIGDDLSVSYGGAENMTKQVETRLDGTKSDEGDVLQELIVDLFIQGSVQWVECVDEREGID